MKKRLILGLTALIVCAVGAAALLYSPEQMQSVSLLKVRQQTAQTSVYCSGVIEQKESIEVYADTTVAIKKVCIAEGDYVEKGDVLFEIDTDLSRKEIFLADSTDYDTALKVQDTICATENGYIETVVGEVDTVCPPELSLATLIPEKSLRARINVSEDIVSDVKIGQQVELTGSGFRDRVYTGKVSSMTAVAKQQQIGNSTQTVLEAVVVINDPDKHLKVGFTTKAKISVDTVDNAIVVPYTSVLEDENGEEFVYRYAGEKVYKQAVKTGVELDDGIQILSGLRSGDRIVCDNVLDGDAIAVSVSEVIG